MNPNQNIQGRGSNQNDAFSRLRLSFWQIDKQITQRHSDRRPKPETAVGTQTKHNRDSKHFPQFNAYPSKTTSDQHCRWLHHEKVTALPVKCHADSRGPKKLRSPVTFKSRRPSSWEGGGIPLAPRPSNPDHGRSHDDWRKTVSLEDLEAVHWSHNNGHSSAEDRGAGDRWSQGPSLSTVASHSRPRTHTTTAIGTDDRRGCRSRRFHASSHIWRPER